jgi:ATP-binding cassette, subfamily C (CFTR/MRP), member 2
LFVDDEIAHIFKELLSTEFARLPDIFVSHKRILNFIRDEDEVSDSMAMPFAEEQQEWIGFQGATLVWHRDDALHAHKFCLRNINLEIQRGSITVIAGAIGAGKSSLLMALLGEMQLLEGKVNLPRKDGVAFVPQASWLLTGTVRDNILFGLPFNKERYDRVIRDCSLEADMETLKAGDLTEIGERG